MGRRLDESINSSRMRKRNLLSNKKKPMKLLVYVEDIDDVAFWKILFNKYESDKYTFKVTTPCYDSFEYSKKQVIERIKKWDSLCGKYFLGCVDSDYDFAADNATVTSKIVNENPFIFQTFAYSIENFLCYPGSG